MNANNHLEMFLTLNAEAFKKGLSAAGTGVRTMAGGVSAAVAETKAKLQEGLGTLKTYNAGLREQNGIVRMLNGSITALLAPLTALVGGMASLTKLVDVTREFDKLSAGLITATGSAAESKKAFAAIQDFATNTPYDLAQVTDGFVKLVNFGLNPSERAMTSYGNTSSALGKNLNQMIEAVADAATGEFERLKEFGIKAKSEGDKVSFTFRGITTTVGKNAREIEEYLIKLGETNFGTAMANRMKTLDGALSNLGDEWNKLFLNISQNGIGDAIAAGVRKVISGLEELNAMIVSGELVGYLGVFAGRWSVWADDVHKSIQLVGRDFDFEMDGIQERGKGTVSFLIDAFRSFPENVRAFVGILTVEVAAGFDKVRVEAKALKDSAKAIFTSSTIDEAMAERDRQLKIFEEARNDSIDAILRERDAAINSTTAQIEAVKRLRAEYEKKRLAEQADTSDRTEKYQVKEDKPAARQAVTAKFKNENGTWVEDQSADESQKAPGSDDQAAKQKAAYQKKLAEKRQQLTPEQFKERQEYWKSLEDERPLTKAEEKEKKAEEAKFRKEETERKRLEKEQNPAAKPERQEQEAVAIPAEPSLLAKERSGQLAGEQEERLAQERKKEDEQRQEEDERKKKKEEEADLVASSASSGGNNVEWRKSQENARKYEESMQQAHEAVAESGKKSAEEWATAQVQAAEKSKSALQKYADKVRSLQDQIVGREKSLAEELDGLGNRGTAESRWRRQAKEAREYEKAAKDAMKAGDLEKALSLSDQAKAAYSSLKGGAGSISDKFGDQAAFKGVKSAGLMGIDIAKAIQQATVKTALTATPGGDLFGDLSGRIRGQLAAVAGGGQEQAAGKGGAPVAKVHELRFPGGSLHGSEDAVEALLDNLAKAGMSA